jgi:hypothetical protein
MLGLGLDGNGLQQIAVTAYGDGRLTVAALGADQAIYRIEQNGPNNDWGDGSTLEAPSCKEWQSGRTQMVD